jgi:hypothetical protein
MECLPGVMYRAGSGVMGLFDTIKCEYPLPNKLHQDLEFQTKDLECLLERYMITFDGRLVRHPGKGNVGLERDIVWPFHGDIRIYDSDPENPSHFVEYVVRFTHGRVEWILSADEVHGGAPGTSEARTPETGMPPGLIPAAWGRRLTLEEYTANTPEQIELIDGEIPGTDKLLLLLLTSVGLRRAVTLVGADRWRKALVEVEAKE